MLMPNMLVLQVRAENMIRRWGNHQKGSIMRAGVERAKAYMARTDYKPTERGLFMDGSERLAVSAINLPSLDFELDTIVFAGQLYKINVPPAGGRPDGTIIYHDCNVLRVRAA